MQDLKAQSAQAQQDRIEMAGNKAKKLLAKAGAEDDLAESTTTRYSKQNYLGDLVATCNKKATNLVSR